MTLYNVLCKLDRDDCLPQDKERAKAAIKNQRFCYNQTKVCLCFMAEEETWIHTYVGHPILMPYYDAEICGLDAADDELRCWIKEDDWIQ